LLSKDSCSAPADSHSVQAFTEAREGRLVKQTLQSPSMLDIAPNLRLVPLSKLQLKREQSVDHRIRPPRRQMERT